MKAPPTEVQSTKGLFPWSTGQPLSDGFSGENLLVLQFKYYFRGRDAAAFQLPRETVGILLLSISIFYDPAHPYIRLQGSVRIFTVGIFTLGPHSWAHRRATSRSNPTQLDSSAMSTLMAPSS